MLIEKKDLGKMVENAKAGQGFGNDTALYLIGEMNKPKDIQFFQQNEDKKRIDKLLATGKYASVGIKDFIDVLETAQKKEATTPELPFRKTVSSPLNLTEQMAAKPKIHDTQLSLAWNELNRHSQSPNVTQSKNFRR